VITTQNHVKHIETVRQLHRVICVVSLRMLHVLHQLRCVRQILEHTVLAWKTAQNASPPPPDHLAKLWCPVRCKMGQRYHARRIVPLSLPIMTKMTPTLACLAVGDRRSSITSFNSAFRATSTHDLLVAPQLALSQLISFRSELNAVRRFGSAPAERRRGHVRAARGSLPP
jgi:hypothetical protein